MERANLDALLRSVAVKGSRGKVSGWRGTWVKRRSLIFVYFFKMGEIASCFQTDGNHPMDMKNC